MHKVASCERKTQKKMCMLLKRVHAWRKIRGEGKVPAIIWCLDDRTEAVEYLGHRPRDLMLVSLSRKYDARLYASAPCSFDILFSNEGLG